MSTPLTYVDRSAVRDGALEELKGAIADLAEWIEANEPQLVAYNAYLNDDGSEITVVHLHADADSLDLHMAVAGPRFRRFVELVELQSIHVYGEPSEKAVAQLEQKARLLGSGEVVIHRPQAGFARLDSAQGG